MYGKPRIVFQRNGIVAYKGDKSSQQIGRWMRDDEGFFFLRYMNGRVITGIGDIRTMKEAKQVMHQAAKDSQEFYVGQEKAL